MRIRLIILFVAGCLAAFGTSAAVQVAPTGFNIHLQVSIGAPRAKVYQSLTEQVGAWWNPDHTYSGDSKNLSMDMHPGGCFCERFPDGGGIEHMRIVYVAPMQTVRMSGALGPMQASGLAGTMTWEIMATDTGTRLQLGYIVGGYMEGGFEKMAPAVESMLLEQLQRLKSFSETGAAGK